MHIANWILLLTYFYPAADLEQVTASFHLTSDRPAKGEVAVSYPYDAVIYNDLIYVSDYYHRILVFSAEELQNQWGVIGEGPGEMKHPPTRLNVDQGAIVVTEMYGWQRHFFTPKGTYLRREALDRQAIQVGQDQFRKLVFEEAVYLGSRYRNDENQCLLSRLEDASEVAFHVSEALLLARKSGFIVVKRSGPIETYDQRCRLQKTFSLPVEFFKKKMQKDPIRTKIASKVQTLSPIQYYQYGLPIIDAELEGDSNLWILVSDENVENEQRKPELVHLYRVDLTTGQPDLKVRLPEPANRIRISNHHLVLVATEYATVRAYSLRALDSLAKK